MEVQELFQEIQRLGERVAVLEERIAGNGEQLAGQRLGLLQTKDATRLLAALEDTFVPECYQDLLARAERLAIVNGRGIVTLEAVHAAIANKMTEE